MLRPLEVLELLALLGLQEMEKYGTHDLAPPPGVGVGASQRKQASRLATIWSAYSNGMDVVAYGAAADLLNVSC